MKNFHVVIPTRVYDPIIEADNKEEAIEKALEAFRFDLYGNNDSGFESFIDEDGITVEEMAGE